MSNYKVSYKYTTVRESVIEADSYSQAKNKFENKSNRISDNHIKLVEIKIIDIKKD